MKSPMSELLCPLSRWAPPTKGRADNIKFNFSFKDTCAKEKLRQYIMMCADVQKCKWLFLWKINRKRGTDLTKKSSKMSDYQQQDMKFEWVKIENSRCCQKCISPCEVLPLCHFHPVIKWCKYFCHAWKY